MERIVANEPLGLQTLLSTQPVKVFVPQTVSLRGNMTECFMERIVANEPLGLQTLLSTQPVKVFVPQTVSLPGNSE